MVGGAIPLVMYTIADMLCACNNSNFMRSLYALSDIFIYMKHDQSFS